MIVNNKPTYKCEHCRKLYQIKSACATHEIACNKNPENDRACFGCVFLRKEKHEEEEPYITRTFDFFYCDKLDHFVHPPKVEHKGNAFDTGEYNLPMRKECDLKEVPETLSDFIGMFKTVD